MGATPGVTYYRCDLPARFLPGKVCRLGEYGDVRITTKGTQFPRQEGAAIWNFAGNTTRAILMAEMQAQGIRVFSEFDDNYQTPPPFEEISEWKRDRASRGKYHADAPTYETATDIARFTDGLIVSTPHLKRIYEPVNENVHVCPNSVDPDDWLDPLPARDILRVGWAASDSHIYDAPLIRDALQWASEQKHVEVVILGIHPEVSRFRFMYRYIPWANNLDTYRMKLRALDVMLCPIVKSEWSDAKSDVKAMEAAMAGACSVVSNVEAYRPWFDKPAYVADQPWDFKKIVKHLVRNRDEVRETARLAREYVLAERDIRQHVHKWREAVGGEAEPDKAAAARDREVTVSGGPENADFCAA